jgi:hypothetical protein
MGKKINHPNSYITGKGTVSRDFFCILTYFGSSMILLVRYIFVKSIKIGLLISHIFRITNHRTLFFLKIWIYIQIVIRLASIHRLSICIIDLPTTGYRYSVVNLPYSVVRVAPRGFPRHGGPAGAKLTSTLPYRIGCSSS